MCGSPPPNPLKPGVTVTGFRRPYNADLLTVEDRHDVVVFGFEHDQVRVDHDLLHVPAPAMHLVDADVRENVVDDLEVGEVVDATVAAGVGDDDVDRLFKGHRFLQVDQMVGRVGGRG